MTEALQTHFKINPSSNETGYKSYEAGSFRFRRDEYFVTITWPKGEHMMAADAFMRAMMRTVAWGFFYGTLAYDPSFLSAGLPVAGIALFWFGIYLAFRRLRNGARKLVGRAQPAPQHTRRPDAGPQIDLTAPVRAGRRERGVI